MGPAPIAWKDHRLTAPPSHHMAPDPVLWLYTWYAWTPWGYVPAMSWWGWRT